MRAAEIFWHYIIQNKENQMLGRYLLILTVVFAALMLSPLIASAQRSNEDQMLDPVVITGTPEGELRHRSTATILVIDEEQIRDSNSSSMTDLLATVGAGFLSEWTPGQTSINIRGGASDGQGRDYKGQVMVLFNGRRAGTANISKLSPNDVYRIEIMRGPNSVMFGSQAIGGIINIITKTGRNTKGGEIDVRAGSWGWLQTHAQYANAFGPAEDAAIYVGGSFGKRDSYHAGKGSMPREKNTQWNRYGGLADVNLRLNEDNNLTFTIRSDGSYNTGFRGSGGNYASREDRSNHSLDVIWEYNPDNAMLSFRLHNYMVLDVDEFKWATLRTGVLLDHNMRKLSIIGTKFQPLFKLTETNELRAGVDFEYSRLRSERYRILAASGRQGFSPYDLNQTEKVLAFYLEDTQRLFDDRFTLRAGIRHTFGWLSSDYTPNMSEQVLGTKKYSHTTWSVGLNFAATDFLSFRAGVATGFRSPTASETTGYASFINNPAAKTYGNPNIKPETSIEYELGMFAHDTGWFVDLSLFHNEIKGRIISQYLPNNVDSMYKNNPGKIIVTGLELASRINVDELTDLGGLKLAFGLYAAYNFKMDDKAKKISATVNTTKPERMYQYQGSIYAQLGGGSDTRWSTRLTGVLRGPLWYNTEESLRIPQFEPYSTYVHRKKPFWVFNWYGEVTVKDSVTVYGGVNNILNKNYHPLYIALDDGTQYLSAHGGAPGTSNPGREFYLGVRYSF
jgi:vitamin B12 transporter